MSNNELLQEIEKLGEESKYEEQGKTFLDRTNSTLDVKFNRTGKHFTNDTEPRDIYTVTLTKDGKSFVFDFGNSIQETKERKANNIEGEKAARLITAYSILACLTKYDVGTLKEFTSEFYGRDSDVTMDDITSTYVAVCNEYKMLSDMYDDDEMEAMQAIN